jgi:predicted outer membrane protein
MISQLSHQVPWDFSPQHLCIWSTRMRGVSTFVMALARRVRGFILLLVLVSVAAGILATGILATGGISATSGWSASVPGEGARKRTTMDAPYGPLYPADVRMLVAVAQAGLWEAPASEDVARRTTNPKVRAVAAQLASEHHILHMNNIAAADRLQVRLPQSPTPQQQAWLDAIRAASGDEMDRLYVNLARAAHGTVYMAIATVRATTENDVIRSTAAIAEEYVSRHMTLLESTGLVDTGSLAVHSTTDARYQALPTPIDMATGAGLALLAAILTLGLVRLGGRKGIEEADEEEVGQWT